MSTREPMTIIFDHVARTLPNGISERKEVLRAVSSMMTDEHPCKLDVKKMITAIEQLQEDEVSLQMKFTKLNTGAQ